jgi:hypothetical protein
MCCTDHKFVAIAAPRGHAKSTAVTHCYTIANIVFRERSFILIVSDTETQAVFFLQDIKKELTENEDLIKLFGIKGLVKDTDSDFIIEFDDGTQCRLIAKGSGQSLRGVKWDGKRPDLIIGDDLENDEIVMNKDRRIKFQRWFTGTLQPALAKHGIIRIVGTILHMDAMLNRLMPKEYRKDRQYLITPLKVIGSRKDVWYAARYRAHDAAMTMSLWGDHKGLDWLRRERQSYMDQGLTDIWSQEYLNLPIDEEHAPFRGETSPTWPPTTGTRTSSTTSAPTSPSLDQKSDYSCS